jgi:excisionase family DNA binding protein
MTRHHRERPEVDVRVDAIEIPASGLMTPELCARYLGMSMRWLEKMRADGGDLPYIKIGRAIRYRRADVDAWLLAQRRAS